MEFNPKCLEEGCAVKPEYIVKGKGFICKSHTKRRFPKKRLIKLGSPDEIKENLGICKLSV